MTEAFISIEDYNYTLPDERIAKFPVEPRDASQLLVYKNGVVSGTKFNKLPDELPENAFLVFNNTKVIPARLFFQKATGAVIELFLLNPVSPSNVVSQVMETTETCTWACMIGNKKKWKGEVLQAYFVENKVITAELIDTEKNLVRFSWKSASFAEVVKLFGEMPLPPYLNRKTEEKDLETYQTVYSEKDGAVAAPTAGLHFTNHVFEELKNKGIQSDFLTLHVGAGTFQPVKVENAIEHTMHSEQIVFSRTFLENLKENLSCVIPVGTTSMRSLESLYWFGVKLKQKKEQNIPFFIEKLYPYRVDKEGVISSHEAVSLILDYMQEHKMETLVGETEIFIFEGYAFRICKGIITNFHQPKSTLLLLISALIGQNWKTVYEYAFQNNFRFLSYGDSSLLLP